MFRIYCSQLFLIFITSIIVSGLCTFSIFGALILFKLAIPSIIISVVFQTIALLVFMSGLLFVIDQNVSSIIQKEREDNEAQEN